MADHGSRDHAQWSASATARNWQCPGALTLAAKVEHLDKESEAAAWGTACHQLSEKCLRQGKQANDFLDTIEKTKEHSFEVDDEMAETAQAYVDYVLKVQSAAATDSRDPGMWGCLMIEQKFSLADLNPPFEAGGTADAVMHNPTTRNLHVIDLKGGRGVVVEATNNPQLRTYALGAMLANRGLDVETVTVTIVQPRAPHKEGRIRSETFHVTDLMEWTADLLAAMRRAKDAMNAFGPTGMAPASWQRTFLSAGAHCKFCPAAGICPALQSKALDAAGVWFDDLDQPRLANAPESLDPGELARILDAADMIEDWLNACRRLAHTLAEGGTEIPDYVLVDKIGRRAWAAPEDKVVSDLRSVVGLTDDEIYNLKLKSPAQIEKLGIKRKKAIENMWHAPVTGTNLVRNDKTTRAAKTPRVNQHFEVLD